MVKSCKTLWVTSSFILLCFISDQWFCHPPPNIIKPRWKFPNRSKITNNWPGITAHIKLKNTLNGLISRKWSLLLHYRDKSRRALHIFLTSLLCWQRLKKHKWVTELYRQTAPWPEVHRSSCMVYFRKTWPTSRWLDQAQWGTLLLRSCSHGPFIWLQVAVKLAARSTTNISATSRVIRSC